MAKQKCVNLLSYCERIKDADMNELGRLTEQAKGDRTGAAFSKVCGLDPGTISRIINVRYTKRVSDDVVACIAVHAANKSPEFLREIIHAQGLLYPPADDLPEDKQIIKYAEYLEELDRIVQFHLRSKRQKKEDTDALDNHKSCDGKVKIVLSVPKEALGARITFKILEINDDEYGGDIVEESVVLSRGKLREARREYEILFAGEVMPNEVHTT